METYADLEISLHRIDADEYRIELRFNRPDSDTEDRLIRDGPVSVHIQRERLLTLMLDDEAYGKLLGENLLTSPKVLAGFDKAYDLAQAQDMALRLRLFIDPNAPELHRLRWETLRDPRDGSLLLTKTQLLFSRYLSSYDWRSVRLRPQAELHALIVIANPTDISDYQFAPLDTLQELERIVSNLGQIPHIPLTSRGEASLKKIFTHLRDEYDILYLMCHGMVSDNEPWLWLEDENGKTQRVSGKNFVTRLQELEQRPRLVVLASCQSAGTGHETQEKEAGALAALGPRLAEAGIPAVIAMQGNVSQKTIEEFMPVFFQELLKDGQIDRAMTVARGTIQERPDWWMPVLFMRLKSGKIWYAPGFTDDQQGLEKWPALLNNIRRKRCTPILGPGLSESLLGSHRELARRWAEAYQFPMAPHNREELPQVAQYLAIHQDPMFPRDSLIEYVCQELQESYQDELTDTSENASLGELLRILGAKLRENDQDEPYRVLAELPFKIYINTNPGNLLADALTAAGKEPRIEICRWNDDIEYPSVYDEEPDYQPDEQHPLVYHLFGALQDLESLILTEDNYFDYLIGVSRNNDLIPDAVRRAWTDTALLFLGFQMDDWDFRVLFRSIMSREGGRRRKKYAHVAAQVTPEEGRILEPKRARRYLEKYFQDSNISIYWGNAGDFVQDLREHWEGGAL